MNTSSKRRGVLVSLGALATATALALGGAVAAQAAPAMPTTSDIVITKLTTPPTGPGAAATGIAAGATGGPTIPAGATPIQNVEFEAYAVPISATPGTNAWQQEIAGMTLAAAQTAIGASPAVAHDFAATAIDGVTTWEDAPRGLYLIREISAPAGVTPTADFLVAVPLTDPANLDNWLDAIYVYPKNSKVSATKSIAEGSSVAVGENVTWTVRADIPRDEAISKFELVDTFDPRLTPLSAAPNAPVVSLTGASGQTLDGTGATPDYTVSVSGQVVTLVFTAEGRAKLVLAWKTDPTAQVELDMVTLVNDNALNPANTAAASITNTAVLTVNDADPINSTIATLKVGDIKITKKNAVGGAALENAVFSVYRTESDAANRVNAISIDGVTTFTSGATGELTISGLFFSDFVNGATVPLPANYRDYWINEVEAPTGFQLLAAPIKFTVSAAGADVTAVDVLNTPNQNGFVLPLTGGTGTLFLTLGGLAILAIVVFAARRRRTAEASAE